MASFSIPLTGLEADSTALNTIANNLANMNTTAYKDQTTNFSSLFYQQLGQSGSGDPIEEGLGVQVDSTETNFTPGTINSTGVASDMAINGDGFFVAQNAQGQQFLTRAGDFTTSSNGNLVTTDGLEVMGYPAVNGTINANGSPSPIVIPLNATQPPQATQNMSIDMNLDATATAGTTVPVPVTLYDSLGNTQQATVNFTANGGGSWTYTISVPGATGNANATGTLQFNGSGVLTSPTTNVSPVTFSGLTDGANNLSFNFNLLDANGNPTITQTASASGVTATPQDGYASGEYQSFTVDQNGVISATYSNGLTAPLAQLAIASVSNEQGLTPVGANDYQTSLASGQASLGVAGTGSRGTIDGSSLEASNVDISTEFANLIVAQRAFEANSKSVTTFDTVMQDTIDMIR
jgi:flagellar hook protein FlgE